MCRYAQIQPIVRPILYLGYDFHLRAQAARKMAQLANLFSRGKNGKPRSLYNVQKANYIIRLFLIMMFDITEWILIFQKHGK